MLDKWKITKILNNNVVFVADNQGQEFIAMGNGIGFRHRVKERLKGEEIMKIFAQVNYKTKSKIVSMLEEIPFDRVELAMHLMNHGELRLERKLNDNLLISLADHLHYLLERYEEGMLFPSVAGEEIKRFYQEEYTVSCEMVDMINQRYQVSLDYEEASTIAFHIINASNQRGQKTLDIMYGVRDIVNIVTDYLGITLDEDSFDYSRFIIHLKFFMRKVVMDLQSEDDADDFMLSKFRIKYPTIDELIQKIEGFILEKYQYQMMDNDKLYLFVHICRLIKSKSTC